MIYLAYEQVLKLYVASSVIHCLYKKESDATKGSYEGLSILYFEFEFLLNRCKSRTGALVVKTKLMRDTFAPTRSQGYILGC
jgi:hypothetical protein